MWAVIFSLFLVPANASISRVALTPWCLTSNFTLITDDTLQLRCYILEYYWLKAIFEQPSKPRQNRKGRRRGY
jgi:hypothetical protein